MHDARLDFRPPSPRPLRPAPWIAAALGICSATLLVIACSDDAAAAVPAPRGDSNGTILVEELGKARILRTGKFQAAFIGSFGLGVRLTPWRHVKDDGSRERSIRLSLGLVPAGEGLGDMFLGGQEFGERAYWQISGEDAAGLIAFVDRLAKAKFVEAGDGVDARFIDALWGSLHFRRFPDGSASVFVFTNQDGNEIWSSVDLGVLRGALEQAASDLDALDGHGASVKFAGR